MLAGFWLCIFYEVIVFLFISHSSHISRQDYAIDANEKMEIGENQKYFRNISIKVLCNQLL
jgi:hypothetical protein